MLQGEISHIMTQTKTRSISEEVFLSKDLKQVGHGHAAIEEESAGEEMAGAKALRHQCVGKCAEVPGQPGPGGEMRLWHQVGPDHVGLLESYFTAHVKEVTGSKFSLIH